MLVSLKRKTPKFKRRRPRRVLPWSWRPRTMAAAKLKGWDSRCCSRIIACAWSRPGGGKLSSPRRRPSCPPSLPSSLRASLPPRPCGPPSSPPSRPSRPPSLLPFPWLPVSVRCLRGACLDAGVCCHCSGAREGEREGERACSVRTNVASYVDIISERKQPPSKRTRTQPCGCLPVVTGTAGLSIYLSDG